jgi:hypothetical protein
MWWSLAAVQPDLLPLLVPQRVEHEPRWSMRILDLVDRSGAPASKV